MEIAPSPLNVLCELCKADFPEGKPWRCFPTRTQLGKIHFRSSSIKQIKDSVALGCHACNLLWDNMKKPYFYDGELTDEDTYYLSAGWYFSDNAPESRITDELCLDVSILPGRWGFPSLHLSRIDSIRKRVDGGENIWEIELSHDINRRIGISAAQCSSLVNLGQRTITQIRKWLQECENDHECCRNKAETLSISGTHGFRLIDVGDGNVIPVHLVNTDQLRHLPRYITLSHRWTGATKLTQLTWRNLDQHLTSIDTERWPQVYKDAVTITRQLHIQYLWIDSICIVQDSREDILRQDWDEQSALMDRIYSNGVLNLASIEETAGEGFKTTRNLLSEFPCVLQGAIKSDGLTTSSYLLYRKEDDQNVINKAPLSKRGWVYQERMLSKRVVHFGRQTYWDCASLFANEAFPSGDPTYMDDPFSSYPGTRSIKTDLQWGAGLRHSRTSQTELFLLWQKIVHSYTPTEFTSLSDRLIALRGIINVIQIGWDIPDTQYAAGMWRKDLPAMMVWFRGQGMKPIEEERATRQNLLHHFPSWSWASCKSGVHISRPQGHCQELISVESMHGSDNKARTAMSAEMILHGWAETVNSALFTGIEASSPYGDWLQMAMSDQKGRVVMRWDTPTDHTSEPWYLLPVVNDRREFRGLVLQHVPTEDEIPTFSRFGYYSSDHHDPVLNTQAWDLEKGENWDAKLLLAPLIRLV